MSTLYFEYHYPIALLNLWRRFLFGGSREPGPANITPVVGPREWWSQPRAWDDQTVEQVTVKFKLPLSVSEVDFEVARRGCSVEVWYQDRSNNWRPVLDRSRQPMIIPVAESGVSDWYRAHVVVYPIVAKQVQFRVRRQNAIGADPYSVGLREILIKRNVYERNQGVQYLEEEEDVFGNIVSKTIKDWDASKANDQNAYTYWKSGPQPDPSAVVALYLDVRDKMGKAQAMDQLYLDPVYAGQQLNLYYSNDDTVTERKLSPISMAPLKDENTDWRLGQGRWDISRNTGMQSTFEVAGDWGPQDRKDAWFGIEWTPDFDAESGPSVNPELLGVIPERQQDAWSPTLRYNVGAGTFDLSISHPTAGAVTTSAPLTRLFSSGETLRVAAGWSYETESIFIRVQNKRGDTLATIDATMIGLPEVMAFDGRVGVRHFRGNITALVLKIEGWDEEKVERFMSNPSLYVSPDPVLPDENGRVPASSLDNAIMAVDWIQQEFPTGGVDNSEFTGKVWTPIWKDFTTVKGMLYFPRMISAKYLKLEFTNLTEEPYPVYESGIEVNYKVFPISVVQQSTSGPALYTGKEVGGLFGVANLNGVKSVNWFNLYSVGSGAQAILGRNYDIVQITNAPSYTTTKLPHMQDAPITNSIIHELGSKILIRREVLDPYILAEDVYYTTIKAEGLIKLQPMTNIPWEDIEAANRGAISKTKELGAVSIRGTDWWIFPGQELRIPAQVMERLTSTSTVVERKFSTTVRVRFTTETVHRYETRTLRRDAAIAYFAGVREVIPMVASFIQNQDKPEYDFAFYSPNQWTMTHTQVMPSGAIGQAPNVPNGDVARMAFSLNTYSQFSKLGLEFYDSGLFRSDAMWASEDSSRLSPNVSPVPGQWGANWSDIFAEWDSSQDTWGSVRSLVSINIDKDRQYDGKRVLRFQRAVGAGEAGLRLKQTTNFIEDGLFRMGCTMFKKIDNDNEVILRLTRLSDMEVVYETPIETRAGKWIDYKTDFMEVPDGEQEYRLELVLSGEEEDELYVSDLYSEIAHVRYFARLGDSSQPLLEITQMRYIERGAVVTPTPTNTALIQVMVLSERGFAFGGRLTPEYLL
jgi:hypothetical protein